MTKYLQVTSLFKLGPAAFGKKKELETMHNSELCSCLLTGKYLCVSAGILHAGCATKSDDHAAFVPRDNGLHENMEVSSLLPSFMRS